MNAHTSTARRDPVARAPFQHRVDAALLRPVECDTLRRFGGPNDGGYLVPAEAIERASTLLAFGMSIDWSFERAAAALNSRLAIGRTLVANRRGARESLDRVRRSVDYFRFFRGRVHHHRRRVWYNDDR